MLLEGVHLLSLAIRLDGEGSGVLTLEDFDGSISLSDVLLLVVTSSGDSILGHVKSLSDDRHILLGLGIASLSCSKEALGRVDSSNCSFLLFNGLVKLHFHSLSFVPECEVPFNFLSAMSEFTLGCMEVTSLLVKPVFVGSVVNQTLLESLNTEGLLRADLVFLPGEAVRSQLLLTALDDSRGAYIVDLSIARTAVDSVVASEGSARVILQASLIAAASLEILLHLSKSLSFPSEYYHVLPVLLFEALDISHSLFSTLGDSSLDLLHVCDHVLESALAFS